MLGRMDLRSEKCDLCGGSGNDPKKRTRQCPKCKGSKEKLVCKGCGEDWPCSGENPDILDQSYCIKGEF